MILVRHTQVAVPMGVCYGRVDLAVAASFPEEAAAVRARIGAGPRRIYSSPAQRCRRLAATLTHGEIQIDERLWELDFGTWENRRWEDIPRLEFDRWANNFVASAPPGGESFDMLARRVAEFRRECPPDAVVVTHAGVIRAWLCLQQGTPLRDAFHRPVAFGECLVVPN